jgi:hypothetical protein
MVPCPATLRRRRLIVDAEVLVILFIVYGGAGRLRASLSEYGGAAIATEKKPLLIGHCALRAILCFNRGDCFDTAVLSMGNAALREKPYAHRCTARRL